ncbi:MAG: hypothetical protein JWO91_3354 [Acidobacteriaceae bacterium]|jgi:hypothetical protein|nr:hypothetical protein [Acidobacteriaceae bacterium]
MLELNSAIELHDSTLASFQQTDQHIVIVFSPAYIHKSVGNPGVDAGSGWVQEAIIRVEAGSIEAIPLELPCDLLHGELRIDNSRITNRSIGLQGRCGI